MMARNMTSANFAPFVDRIFDALRRYGSILPDRRRAGLDPAHIEGVFYKLGLDAPKELIDLYSYCDGTATSEQDIIGKIVFFPGYYWMDLDLALEEYEAISKIDRWKRDWVPIFANGGGDFYAIICDRKSPFFGEIVGFMIGDSCQIVEYKSLLSMMEIIAECYDEGAFFPDGEFLEIDDAKMTSITRKVQAGFLEHEI